MNPSSTISELELAISNLLRVPVDRLELSCLGKRLNRATNVTSLSDWPFVSVKFTGNGLKGGGPPRQVNASPVETPRKRARQDESDGREVFSDPVLPSKRGRLHGDYNDPRAVRDACAELADLQARFASCLANPALRDCIPQVLKQAKALRDRAVHLKPDDATIAALLPAFMDDLRSFIDSVDKARRENFVETPKSQLDAASAADLSHVDRLRVLTDRCISDASKSLGSRSLSDEQCNQIRDAIDKGFDWMYMLIPAADTVDFIRDRQEQLFSLQRQLESREHANFIMRMVESVVLKVERIRRDAPFVTDDSQVDAWIRDLEQVLYDLDGLKKIPDSLLRSIDLAETLLNAALAELNAIKDQDEPVDAPVRADPDFAALSSTARVQKARRRQENSNARHNSRSRARRRQRVQDNAPSFAPDSSPSPSRARQRLRADDSEEEEEDLVNAADLEAELQHRPSGKRTFHCARQCDLDAFDEATCFDKLSKSTATAKIDASETYRHHQFRPMTDACQFCQALFYPFERNSNKLNRQFVFGEQCCFNGKLKVDALPAPPDDLINLLKDSAFKTNIRSLNNSVAFASTKVDDAARQVPGAGRGVPFMRVHGSVHHSVGAVLPGDGPDAAPPAFSQLLIYDGNEQLRLKQGNPVFSTVPQQLLQRVQDMIHSVNPFTRFFRNLGSIIHQNVARLGRAALANLAVVFKSGEMFLTCAATIHRPTTTMPRMRWRESTLTTTAVAPLSLLKLLVFPCASNGLAIAILLQRSQCLLFLTVILNMAAFAVSISYTSGAIHCRILFCSHMALKVSRRG